MCNCHNTSLCPLDGECQQKCVIYQVTIETDGHVLPTEKYVALTETSFKQRYYNHLTTFKHESKTSTTELSKHI